MLQLAVQTSLPSTLDLAMVRYAEGDAGAFPELFRELAPRLRSLLRRLSGCEQLAQDLVQETFLHIHRARESFVRGQRVIPWAFTIARNCFVSHARSPRARIARESSHIEQQTIASEVAANAEDTLAARETASVLERALGEMCDFHRHAFTLVRFEGLSAAEAAASLGATESAVRLRTFRASETLRATLDARGLASSQRVARARAAA